MDRRARRKRGRSESIRQTLGVIAVGCLIGTSLFVTGGYVSKQLRLSPARVEANGSEAYTGSILYTPDEGRTCHQVMFDNHTGRFTDNGSVDCESAAYKGIDGNQAKQWSSARARVIADGFRQH
jgi:hypothetical protein